MTEDNFRQIKQVIDDLCKNHYIKALSLMPKGQVEMLGGIQQLTHYTIGRFPRLIELAKSGDYKSVANLADRTQSAIFNYFPIYMEDLVPGAVIFDVGTSSMRIMIDQQSHSEMIASLREVINELYPENFFDLLLDTYSAMHKVEQVCKPLLHDRSMIR